LKPLDFNSGFILIKSDGSKIWCKSGTKVVGGLFALSYVGEVDGVFELSAGNAKSEPIRDKHSEQSTEYAETTGDQNHFIGSRLHGWIIILSGGFGGIAIGLVIGRFILLNFLFKR